MAFERSSVGVIRDCSFYDVGGNITTSQHYHLKVYLANGTQIGPVLDSLRPRFRQRIQQTASNGISGATSQAPSLPLPTYNARPNALDVVEYAFQTLDHLVAPSSNTLLKKVHRDLQELQKMVALSYIAYQACRGTEVGSLVGRQMEKDIQHCAATLTGVHCRISNLVRGSLYVWDTALKWMPAQVADVLDQYWEPADVASIRSDISKEMEAFGLCLSAIKS